MVEMTVYDLQDWVMKGTAASSLRFLLILLLESLTLGEASSNAIRTFRQSHGKNSYISTGDKSLLSITNEVLTFPANIQTSEPS